MPAIIKVVDGRTVIKVGENTVAAGAAAALAEQFANAAGVSADAVEIAAAAVGVYATVGAGESATTNGQSFYVASGGDVTLYLNNAGTGEEVASIVTTAKLASTAPGDGVDLISGVAYPVDSRTALSALPSARYQIALLNELGREGRFEWASSDLSAEVAADTMQGIYIPPNSDPTGASGAWVRDTTDGLPVTATGAVRGDMANDYYDNLTAVFLLSARLGIPVIGGGPFRTGQSLILGEDYSSLETRDIIGVNLYGDFGAANTAAVMVPQIGDNYGGNVAPANDLNLAGFDLDGTNAVGTAFTTGLAVFGGERNRIGRVRAQGYLKSGVLLTSILGLRTDVHIDDIISHDNTNGSVGQGMAADGRNADDNITWGRAELYNNGLWGIDFSGGVVSFGSVLTYGNNTVGGTGGGGKFTGADNQVIRGQQYISRDNAGKGLLSNTGPFKLLSIDHFESVNDSSDGLDVPFSGTVRIGYALLKGAGARGIIQTTGKLHIDLLELDGNTGNGAAIGGDVDVYIGEAITRNHPVQEGLIITTTGSVFIGSGSSEQDDQGFARIVPSSANPNISIGPVTVEYTGTPTVGPCVGVFLSANAVRAKLGKVTATGTATAITNNGVNTNPLTANNSVAATTLGTVTAKVEAFDAAGNSLGFMPVYDAIA